MQGNPTYFATANAMFHRKSFLTFVILVLFLLLGAAIGYAASQAAVNHATLNVQVENDTGVSQDIRILLNDDEVASVNVATGASVTLPIQVGWTSTANGLFEVRAEPVTSGAGDSETRSVSNGQTLLVSLRVR